MIEFKDQYDFVINTIEIFEKSLNYFKENKIWLEILGIILALGNIMNGGDNRRGQASGILTQGIF